MEHRQLPLQFLILLVSPLSIRDGAGVIAESSPAGRHSDGRSDEDFPEGRYVRYNAELGKGAYKVVYKGYDNETGTEVAWNKILILEIKRIDEKDKRRLLEEIGTVHYELWIAVYTN